ncbi:minor tail protein [Mycobacterium phage Tortellini]|uniref:Minor tail protein n=1 Tax=Mycobacterium phage Tortellini TaxID=1897497 RepID=A0A1D8EX42_9CAUD|nr:minor tail protein [Mycobacterium phage Tortellini]AOT25767.1 minor tail protein [Mycobacterium phage Tortellini]
MPWSPSPTVPQRQHRTAWFAELPAPQPAQHQTAWFPLYRVTGTDSGVGEDSAIIVPRLVGTDTGIGADQAALTRVGDLLAVGTGLGADSALIVPELIVLDSGAGVDDAARIGLHGADSGIGTDSVGSMKPGFAVFDSAVGADMLANLKPGFVGTDSGLGADSGTIAFTSMAAVETSYTTPGAYTYKIPVWCRYVDIVLCGSGRGGNGNSGALAGAGGNAGGWAGTTLERGVSIGWEIITITIVVPDGGNGGSGAVIGVGGQGANGSAATASVVSGSPFLSAPGGSGERSGNQSGGSPGNYTYSGWKTFTGGAETTSGNGTAGNPPGGGGRGGNGNFIGTNSGGKGAPGAAYLRARQ